MRLRTAVFLALFATVARPAQGQDTLARREAAHVNLSASASIRVQPERVTLYLLVDAPGATVGDAAARSHQSAGNVADTLSALGGREVLIQVTGYGAGPASQMDRTAANAAASAYLGRTVVRAEVNRLALMPALVEAAFARGATDLGGMRFSVANPDSLRQVALAQALVSLKADAETMARGLGRGLGRLTHVSSHAGYNPMQPVQLSAGNQYQSGQAWLTPPDVIISVTANAAYELVDAADR